jgi:hypothetical protein
MEEKPIKLIEVTLKVEGKENFKNVWSVENTTLEKAQIVEQVLMGCMPKLFEGLNKNR